MNSLQSAYMHLRALHTVSTAKQVREMQDQARSSECSFILDFEPRQANFKISGKVTRIYLKHVGRLKENITIKYFKETLDIFVKVLRYLQSNFGKIVGCF